MGNSNTNELLQIYKEQQNFKEILVFILCIYKTCSSYFKLLSPVVYIT